MKRVLITGGAGLVGTECCRLFAQQGWEVVSVDNNTRGKIFGQDGSTKNNIDFIEEMPAVTNHEIDIRDEKMVDLIKKSDAIIHAAAQPSHPKSIEIPVEDFHINAWGTLFLLENVRKHNPDIPFVFCSTNKVYGDKPNELKYKKADKRFEPEDDKFKNGFDESLPIDHIMHTPFGVSKTAADLYTQEYAKLYGLKAASFRMGCITGGAAKAVEMHNWEPFFIKKAMAGETLHVYGYGGYQVRDVIHARDLAWLFLEYIKKPRSGEAYNIGGARQNSISLLESFDLIEEVTGHKMKYDLKPEREADHIWWISDISKARKHFPSWKIRIGLKDVFREIYNTLKE